MSEEKLTELKDQLSALGLKSLHNELEQGYRSKLQEFSFSRTATYSPAGKKPDPNGPNDRFTISPHYKRDGETGEPRLEMIQTQLVKANGETDKQTFLQKNATWMTGKDMYNMLSGRAVQKDVPKRDSDGKFLRLPDGKVDKQPVWFKLELDKINIYGDHPVKTFYPGYKFDLTKTVGTYHPDNYENEARRTDMLKELRKGNLEEATIPVGKKQVQVFIAANPEERQADIYTAKDLKPIPQETIFPELKKNATTMTDGNRTAKQDQTLAPESELTPDNSVGTSRGR